MNKRIYLSPPDVGAEERRLLLEAFDSNWIAPLGPHVDAFERDFAAAIGMPHAVALSSGTAALHLALHAIGVSRGDVVITSTLTFAATANAITYVGAQPVFIDCAPSTWTMDPDLLEEELHAQRRAGRPVGAVVTVDLYGEPCDYDRIASICGSFDVPLVADAAEALGSRYKGQPTGTFSECAAFSFNGNKIITTSGGGMLVSSNRTLIERVRYFATQARQPAPHYEHTDIGFNYRMSNLLAAVGRGQLGTLDAKLERRRAINARYRAAFAGVPGLSITPELAYAESNCWLTRLMIDVGVTGVMPEDVRRHLESGNIEARPVWKPMHLQPVFRACPVRGGAIAAGLFETGLCLPSGSSLTSSDQERVIAGVFSSIEDACIR